MDKKEVLEKLRDRIEKEKSHAKEAEAYDKGREDAFYDVECMLEKHLESAVSEQNHRPELKSYKDLTPIEAFARLVSIRDCYRQGWLPEWDSDEPIYCIHPPYISVENGGMCVFAFELEEQAHDFFQTYSDLLFKIRELIIC